MPDKKEPKKGEEKFGHYVLMDEFSPESCSVVYRAHDERTRRDVALKVYTPPRDDPAAFDRFLGAARIVAKLKHPNVVSVLEAGYVENRPFIATDFVEGKTLDEYLKEKQKLTASEAIEICAKLADGLHCLHKTGIVHRDIKPQNIILASTGEPIIADFGLAIRQSESQLTETGTIMGTPSHMSPEQWHGPAVDARSDVYSLGVVLYQLLTGNLPFRADPDSLATLSQRRHPPSLRSLEPTIPAQLEDLCLRALAMDPGERYASAADFGDALRHWLRRTQFSVATPIRFTTVLDLVTSPKLSFGLSGLGLVTSLLLFGARVYTPLIASLFITIVFAFVGFVESAVQKESASHRR